jgi:hypothetical protein
MPLLWAHGKVRSKRQSQKFVCQSVCQICS